MLVRGMLSDVVPDGVNSSTSRLERQWTYRPRSFGITVTFIAVLQGFEAQATPEGVSRATTRTVVVASLAVLGLDFILTALMFSI